MIVRISGEGQYRLEDQDGALAKLDEDVLTALSSGQEDRFHDAFDTLLGYIRSSGQQVPEDELEPSDLILPPPDLSLAEARKEFTGEGLIPD